MIKAVYSIVEVADFFNVSTRTIRLWMRKDESFPRPHKRHGTLRFHCNEIERYWTDNMLSPEEQAEYK
jgi:hypothetical protein